VSSGGASAAKEPGHTSSSQVTRMHFFPHIITEAKQSNRQGGARAVDLPAMSFDLM